MKIIVSLFALILLVSNYSFAQKVVALYEGKAPGSENWNYQERESAAVAGNRVAYNVANPNLTIFMPTTFSNGTAVIICPGGGFHTLSVDTEGNEVAQWLNKKGVTCFVLRYRTAQSFTENPLKELFEKDKKTLEAENAPVMPLAIADGKRAVEYVRTHAAEYNIASNRIVLMGFSAGGAVAMGVTLSATPEDRPDFVAPIYTNMKRFPDYKVPNDAPPIFICAATDDQLGLATHSSILYTDWVNAQKDAELHIYSKGGHGFGVVKSNHPVETWIEHFSNWLEAQGLYKGIKGPDWLINAKPEDFFKGKKMTEERLKNDWQWFGRYREANMALMPPKNGENRVVFLGNSITEGWQPDFFKNKPYINRGIGGQTSNQLLVRFRPDVINLKPKVVVLKIGINDIAENNGPYNEDETFGNIVSMVELAQANRIKMILCSVLPANTFVWRTNISQVGEKVLSLNKRLKTYAQKNKVIFCDYYPAMVDEKKGLKAAYTSDGVHLTPAGYKVMEEMVEKEIAKALKNKNF